MSLPSEEVERTGPTIAPKVSDFYFNLAISIVWLIAIAWFVTNMMGESGVRLRVLHVLVKSSQWVASNIGVLALLAEQAYNDTASTLH